MRTTTSTLTSGMRPLTMRLIVEIPTLALVPMSRRDSPLFNERDSMRLPIARASKTWSCMNSNVARCAHMYTESRIPIPIRIDPHTEHDLSPISCGFVQFAQAKTPHRCQTGCYRGGTFRSGNKKTRRDRTGTRVRTNPSRRQAWRTTPGRCPESRNNTMTYAGPITGFGISLSGVSQ